MDPDKPQYYTTIHLADIDGQPGAELIGRSTRTFVPCFFQTPPRGGSPCIIISPSPPSGWKGTFTLKLLNMLSTQLNRFALSLHVRQASEVKGSEEENLLRRSIFMDTVLERMKDDMLVRNLAPATERSYIKYTADYIERFRQWPELLDSTHVRDFQLFLLEERKNGLGVRSTLQFVHFAFFIA